MADLMSYWQRRRGKSEERGRPQADFTLTILHNNDGESSLLPLVSDECPAEVDSCEYGRIARFQEKVDTPAIWVEVQLRPGRVTQRGVVLGTRSSLITHHLRRYRTTLSS